MKQANWSKQQCLVFHVYHLYVIVVLKCVFLHFFDCQKYYVLC